MQWKDLIEDYLNLKINKKNLSDMNPVSWT